MADRWGTIILAGKTGSSIFESSLTLSPEIRGSTESEREKKIGGYLAYDQYDIIVEL